MGCAEPCHIDGCTRRGVELHCERRWRDVSDGLGRLSGYASWEPGELIHPLVVCADWVIRALDAQAGATAS